MKDTNQIAFEFLGNKYRATRDLKLIEAQSPMSGLWIRTDSARVVKAAKEAIAAQQDTKR